MDSQELREKFLNFFEKRGHKIVPSSSLIPPDPSVLFTTAGMQQFKPYYLGKESPYGPNVASCQKCFRTSDIDEVGDERHLTFFEMLGNFSFGGYFKEETIRLAFDFLFKELKLPLKDVTITVFEGDEEVPEDIESTKIWERMGIPKRKIKKGKREDNFWGPTGEEGPCGPTTEIYFGKLEVWNLVFNEYYQDRNKKLTPLKQKGVDTGMGLERLALVSQKKENVFETDVFLPILEEIEKQTKNSKLFKQNNNCLKGKRIIADHIKGATFLIAEGILPSNVERGYILRRILRRAIRYGKLLKLPKGFLLPLIHKVIKIYENTYPELKTAKNDILTVIQSEEEKFEKTLSLGLKKFEELVKKGKLSGQEAFHLFDTFGFPFELTKEMAKEKGIKIDVQEFEEAFKKHKEISRQGAKKKFGGIGTEANYQAIKLHTATHLLHAALRKILGQHVKQMGSDITSERLRFDFSHSRKLTPEEIKKIEDLVNQKIKENLRVEKKEMTLKEALKSGALAFFKEKYPEKVTVYSIGNFSKEICAGPHVKQTGELGCFKIKKEEAVGSGIRRIRAVLE